MWEDRAVKDELQRRVAANETLLRDVNEAIERGQWPGQENDRVGFRCECARLGCDQVIELTIGEYEEVRAHSRRFAIAEGHQLHEEEETIVDSGIGWVVVEKRERAGEIAEATDPRE
jgi:hypothetical protein